MTGSHKFHVRIFRDSFCTPWGFRLQGGKDINQTLVVQRVFSNTPAEGELQRGDVILSIGDRRGEDLTHKQAKDLIEGGGGTINLVVQRTGSHPPPPTVTSPAPSAGHQGVQPQTPTFRTPAPVAPRTNPPKAMPYQGGGSGGHSGHKPKKVTLSKLGGGGPDFGADYSRSYAQPAMHASQPSHRPVPQSQSQGQMLNRVQESLDNIIYSPRTPEPYQSSPFYGQPAAPPPFQPNMSMSGMAPMQQQQYQPQQQAYRPTFEQVDSGQYDEEQEDFVPVWERRKTFIDQPKGMTRSTRSTPIPKVPKPVAFHPEAPSFGTDYSKPQSRPTKWTPQRAPQPRVDSKPVQSTPPRYQNEPESMAPWRESLRSTGVKPWDVDLDFTAQQPTPSQAQSTQSAPPPAPKPAKEGERDWNDSAVFRMIQQEERRGPPGPGGHAKGGVQPPRPPPAPKPMSVQPPQYQAPMQYGGSPYEEELGVSDF